MDVLGLKAFDIELYQVNALRAELFRGPRAGPEDAATAATEGRGGAGLVLLLPAQHRPGDGTGAPRQGALALGALILADAVGRGRKFREPPLVGRYRPRTRNEGPPGVCPQVPAWALVTALPVPHGPRFPLRRPVRPGHLPPDVPTSDELPAPAASTTPAGPLRRPVPHRSPAGLPSSDVDETAASSTGSPDGCGPTLRLLVRGGAPRPSAGQKAGGSARRRATRRRGRLGAVGVRRREGAVHRGLLTKGRGPRASPRWLLGPWGPVKRTLPRPPPGSLRPVTSLPQEQGKIERWSVDASRTAQEPLSGRVRGPECLSGRRFRDAGGARRHGVRRWPGSRPEGQAAWPKSRAVTVMPARSSSASTRNRSMSRSIPLVCSLSSCSISSMEHACMRTWS